MSRAAAWQETPHGGPVRVLHVITRMIVGGAQENTMLSCALIDRARFPSELLSGIETGSEGELHGETRARGVTHHLEPALVRNFHPWRDALALFRLVRFMRAGRYDLVHTHSSKAGILGRIAARLSGVPIVVHTVHGWAFTPAQPRIVFWVYRTLERWCARWTDRIVVVGNPDREEGLALGIGSERQYVLIRSGIEVGFYRDVAIDRTSARARIGVPADAFVVGSIGRLGPQKAPLDLLAAFEEVARAMPAAHLVLVGDGPQRAEVERATARAGLEARVHLLGLRRDVPEILRALDVFALASRWEGLPRVFPQAMAASLPIVATRVDGATDAVADGENGWLVNPGDGRSFADRLLALARDPGLAARMGECGLRRVGEFSADAMIARLEEMYGMLAGPRGLAG